MLTKASFLPLSCILFSACSGASGTDPGPKAGDGRPASTAPPPPPCEPGTYRDATRADPGSCRAFPSLSVARSPVAIAPARDHHASAVVETDGGAYLYVFGGARDGFSTVHLDVQRAKLHDDGTLEGFEPAGSLPEPRAGHCLAKLGERWLVAGGIVQKNGAMGTTDTTLLVKLGADGKVTEATPGPKIPLAVMHLTCNVADGWVYAVGGVGGRGAGRRSTTMSARAKIAPDGTLGPFEPQTPLNPDRSHHAAFVRGRRLFVVGGYTGDPVGNAGVDRDDVIYADLSGDGTLGAWKPGGKLPVALSVSSAELYEDAVYVFGGLDGSGAFTDAIQRATFQDDGTMTRFETLKAKLPAPRGHVHETPVWKSFIFSIGGQDDTGSSLGTLDVGTFGG